MTNPEDDAGDTSIVWRAMGCESAVAAFLRKFPDLDYSSVFREGDRDRLGRLIEESGFNCPLSSGNLVGEASGSLVSRLAKYSHALAFAREVGINGVIDVGVMFCPEDLVGGMRLGVEELRLLSDFGVDLEFSVYAVGDSCEP